MIPKTLLNPPTGVLPFDMFHLFGPMLDNKQAWIPPYDIYETDREIVLKVELPEMHNEDVRVTLENGVLTLRGERKFKETVNRENYHRIERKYGQFMRTFILPAFVEGDKVVAEFNEGVLTVTLPKNAEARPRQSQVEVL
jgi:HSP20 family protein